LQSRPDIYHTELFTVFTDETNFWYRDFFVEAIRLVLSYG